MFNTSDCYWIVYLEYNWIYIANGVGIDQSTMLL